jgi:hypothetical protein
MSYPTRIKRLAKHLKVAPSQVKIAQEWCNCWFVVIRGVGARFVSKAITSIKTVVAKVFSIVEGYTIAPWEVQKLEVVGDQVHVRIRGQLTYCGVDYFRELVQQLSD